MSQKPAAYLWTLDNTDGIPGNKPAVEVTLKKVSPFGRRGVDYSSEYKVTCEPLYRRPPDPTGSPLLPPT